MEDLIKNEIDYMSELEKLSAQSAISGSESEVSGIISDLFRINCDSVDIDRFYNVIGFMKGFGENRKKVIITAHYDEIGMLVKSIDKNGFVKVSKIGGIDNKILLAQEVMIHGKRDVFGVIGAKPPHLLKPGEAKKAVKLEDLYIDIGLSQEKAKEIISIGDVITFHTQPSQLKGNKLSSKSLDNRISIIALMKISEELRMLKHKCDVYLIASTQEEVGAAGAKIAAFNLNPDAAIVLDACHGDMQDTPKDATFALGKGPAIGVGPILHKKLSKKLIELAKEDNIPHQIDIEPDDTGTEAWETQVSRSGIPTMLVSIPLRYMHTCIETVNIDDIKDTGKLVARFIAKFEEELLMI